MSLSPPRRARRVHHALMRVRRDRLLWLLAVCGPLLLMAYIAVSIVTGQPVIIPDTEGFQDVYPNLVFGALVPLLGALVLARVPRHPIGWLFLVCGLASAVTLVIYPAAQVGLQHQLPGGLAAAWVSEWIWGFGLIPLVTLGVLLFPDGRPPAPRWRLLVIGDLAAVLLVFVANAFHPGRLVNHPSVDNPLGVSLPTAAFAVVRAVGMGLFVVGLVGAVAATVLRWRRARGTERDALRWFAFSVATLAVVLLAPVGPHVVADVATAAAVPLVPLSMATAILRTRLYGIEVVVRRSLAYAALTAVLLLGYAVIVTSAGLLLPGPATGPGALAATALVAVAFVPVRTRLQQAVDRMLYGDRGDPYAVLSRVSRRLEGPAEPADPMTEVAATVGASLRLPYVRVEVHGEDDTVLVGSHGEPVPELHEVPLTFRGERLGRLLVAPRTSRDRFRTADLRLLDDLGRQIGVAAHATRLAVELQRSREGLVTAREEERRRIRRDLHDGLGPALAGVALGLDAVHRLAVDDPARAAALADQLKQEVQGSLADVRRLVEDLRPPALDQLGLIGAVRQQARLLSERDPALQVAVEAVPLDALPAAVEVAAYRIATEALTNVSRHAAARHCRVGIGLNGGGALQVEVEDDGVGIGPERRLGIGITAMRERAAELGGSCETGPAGPGGTLVRAQLPMIAR